MSSCRRALRIRGSAQARLDSIDAACRDLERAEALEVDGTDDGERAWLLALRATVCFHRTQYAQALELADVSRALHHAASDWEGEAEALITAGTVAFHIGDFARALTYYRTSQKLFEREHNLAALSIVTSNIAAVHGTLGEHPRAVEVFEQARSLAADAGVRTPLVELNLGFALAAVGELDRAAAHASEALRRACELGARESEGMALLNVGSLYRMQGKYGESRNCIAEALRICATTASPRLETSAHLDMGRTLLLLDQPVEAEPILLRALDLSAIAGPQHVADIHLALSELYQAQGNFERALYEYQRMHLAKELASGAQVSEKVRAAIVQGAIEQSERDAAVLRESNETLLALNEGNARLLRTLAEQAAALERLSLEDALTGAHNRRHLDAQLASEWERRLRTGHPLTVALLDIDHFKAINDTYSHAAGDEVLRSLAAYLRAHTRHADIVARYGGEEFAIVYVDTSRPDAALACEALRAGFAALKPGPSTSAHRVTVSIGVASADEVSSVADLLGLADTRLYAAKHRGRDRVVSEEGGPRSQGEIDHIGGGPG